MIAFLELSDIGRAVMISLFFAAFVGLLFLLIACWKRLRRNWACLTPALVLLLIGLDLFFLMEGQRSLDLGFPSSPAQTVRKLC